MISGLIQYKISRDPKILIYLPVICLLVIIFQETSWAKPIPKVQSGWFVDMQRYASSAHGALKCEDCHGSMMGNGLSHPNIQDKEYLKHEVRQVFDYKNCERCHRKSYERYLSGDHAIAMAKEKETASISKIRHAPVCGDCHSAHYTKSHLSRKEIGIEQTESCGRCHPDQKRSYLANYHGKAAVNLGYDKSASCTDCHGGHNVLSLKDPVLALQACQRCHPDAQPQFANIIIHDSRIDVDKKNETKQTGIHRVHMLSFMSLIFVVSILVFFYSHSCLLMLRKLQEKLRNHK